jgi:hypothetical protein
VRVVFILARLVLELRTGPAVKSGTPALPLLPEARRMRTLEQFCELIRADLRAWHRRNEMERVVRPDGSGHSVAYDASRDRRRARNRRKARV